MAETNQLVIDEQSIKNMTEKHDFSSIEGNVPEFVRILLKVSPDLMRSACEVALDNNKVRTEMFNYIHETSNQVLAQYSDIAKSELEILKDNSKILGEVLLQVIKKEELSPNELQVYLVTLQQFSFINTQVTDSVDRSEKFYVDFHQSEIEASKPKESIVIKAAAEMVQTPEGQKLIIEGLFLVGKALYNSFSKNRK